MTVQSLFLCAAANCNVILKDAADDGVLFAGKFNEFPYKYAAYYVNEYKPVGSALVIWIYN